MKTLSKIKNIIFGGYKDNKDISTLKIEEVNGGRGDKFWMRFQNIGNNRTNVLEKISKTNEILNEKFKGKAKFFVDPSFEKGIGVSVNGKYNDVGASLRIISDGNEYKDLPYLSRDARFLSFLGYDIIHEEEKEMLKEAIKEYIKI